jgi:hypothetical protein
MPKSVLGKTLEEILSGDVSLSVLVKWREMAAYRIQKRANCGSKGARARTGSLVRSFISTTEKNETEVEQEQSKT